MNIANMTYAELAEIIQDMTVDQLNSDVTVYDSKIDEFFSLRTDRPYLISTDDLDVLDTGHPYLVI